MGNSTTTSTRNQPVFMAREEWNRWLTRERVSDAWGRYLKAFHWQIYATMTFAHEKSDAAAFALVKAFVKRLGSKTYGIVAVERGGIGMRTHAHVLLGGLAYPSIPVENWPHGDMRWERFDPARGATWYAAKNEFDEPDTIEIVGHLKRWHPTRRKRGRRRLASLNGIQ